MNVLLYSPDNLNPQRESIRIGYKHKSLILIFPFVLYAELDLETLGIYMLITGTSLIAGVFWTLLIVFFVTIWLITVCEGGSSTKAWPLCIWVRNQTPETEF